MHVPPTLTNFSVLLFVTSSEGIEDASTARHPYSSDLTSSNANGDAVVLLHGVGDNCQGMMGFAELFFSNGFAVLVPDSRAQGESGGDFPTDGLSVSALGQKGDIFKVLTFEQHRKCLVDAERPVDA
jgi:alpha-beta hydrolase superfamily lysophospholipase